MECFIQNFMLAFGVRGDCDIEAEMHLMCKIISFPKSLYFLFLALPCTRFQSQDDLHHFLYSLLHCYRNMLRSQQ